MLVDYLSTNYGPIYGDAVADWCREYWTGVRGRMCLAHSEYGGSNNTMGVEGDWREVKKIGSPSSNLGTFLRALFHHITELGKEHEEHLIKCGTPNAFTSSGYN